MNEKTMTPDDIANLSDDEFARYIAGVRDDLSPAPEEPENTPEEPETEPEEPETEPQEEPETEQEEPETEPEGPRKSEPYKSFATRDEYESEIAREARLLSNRDRAKEDEQRELFKATAREYFGEDVPDPYKRTADDMVREMAQERKTSEDDIRDRIGVNMNAAKYEAQQKAARDMAEQRDAIVNGWQREADVISKLDPDFNYAEALKTEEFAKVLGSGGSVADAYKALKETERDTPPQKDVKPRKSVKQEGQGAARPGSAAEVNPATDYSTAEFMKYINKLKGN